MAKCNCITRRRFLFLGGAATAGILLAGGCSPSGSDLEQGDRSPATNTPSVSTDVPADQAPLTCPFGRVNDPYPGKCDRYIDKNGNDICDLSEPVESSESPERPTASPTQTSTPRPESAPESPPKVDCPFGRVNDPYPGKCKRYVDKNGNGLCDLSEPK